MPNPIAYLMLFGWPIVVVLLFRRLPLPAALVWSLIGGYLLLPLRTGLDLPMVPTIDKDAIPSLAALVMCFLLVAGAAEAVRRRTRMAADSPGAGGGPTRVRPAFGPPPPEAVTFRRTMGGAIVRGLIVLAFAAILLTVLQNKAPVRFGPTFIPGLRLYDAASIFGSFAISLLPFLLGRRYLATPESHVTLLRIFCIAALGYSLLALYESRMSPQLNLRLYGFFNGSFRQQMRGGGFRPLVFLQHGLWLGIFNAMAALAAVALWRQAVAAGKPKSWRWFLAFLWLLMVLVISHSSGALLIGILLLPLALLMGVRGQLLVAAVLAGVVLLYPMLRGAGLVPVDTMLSWARSIDEERANSLNFRLKNEDILMARANEKPLAGWGTWGRNRVYSDITGSKLSTTDGMWIITIGSWGWLGYIARFGLLTLPIFFLALNRRRLDLTYATSGLALMLVANLTDMIPNATLTPISWLVGGALVGRYALAVTAQAQDPLLRGAALRAPRARSAGGLPVAVRGQSGPPGRTVPDPGPAALSDPVIRTPAPPDSTKRARPGPGRQGRQQPT